MDDRSELFSYDLDRAARNQAKWEAILTQLPEAYQRSPRHNILIEVWQRFAGKWATAGPIFPLPYSAPGVSRYNLRNVPRHRPGKLVEKIKAQRLAGSCMRDSSGGSNSCHWPRS
jgi:hypothetical protein